MSTVAYKERDFKLINKQYKKSFIYKAFRKLFQKIFLTKQENCSRILVYVNSCDEKKYYELINKLLFAFPHKKNLSIDIYIRNNLHDINTEYEFKYQRNYLKNNSSHTNIISSYKSSDYDLILLHNAKDIKKFLLHIHKTAMIDENFYSVDESAVYQNYYYYTFSKQEQEQFYAVSYNNYEKLYNKHKYKEKSYCFVTGPSFDRYKEFEYEKNSLKIICNSTVKNDEFLEYINGPDILVFADPVFHFSSCKYSSLFRDKAVEVIQKYKCFVAVPYRTVPLLLNHYPQIKNYIIGIEDSKEFNFPTVDKIQVKGSGNILTLYMLPIASSITKEIYILGADGRDPNEKYFWKHSSSAQYDDLMNSVFETHPSFFRDRDYKDYYSDHVSFLENLITYGESNNKKYHSLTSSHIKCLNDRLF